MRKLLKKCLTLLLCIGFILSCSACEQVSDFVENLFQNGSSTEQPNETPSEGEENNSDNENSGGNTDSGNTDDGNNDGGNTDGGNTDGGDNNGGNSDDNESDDESEGTWTPPVKQ